METTLNINLKTIIVIIAAVLLFMGGGFGWLNKRLGDVNDQLQEQKILNEALLSKIEYTKNKLDEEVATKKTLQTTLKKLNELNSNLSENQKELVKRIGNLQNKNNLISAALIRTETKLDSALFSNTNVDVNEKDSTLTFKEINDSISFDITVIKALPASKKIKPTIIFNSLVVPNKQFIEFNWENDKKYKQKPISFSVSNSNPLMKTTDIDSYTIPEVNKNAIKPTGWEKVNIFFKDRKTEIVVGVIATSVGLGVGAFVF